MPEISELHYQNFVKCANWIQYKKLFTEHSKLEYYFISTKTDLTESDTPNNTELEQPRMYKNVFVAYKIRTNLSSSCPPNKICLLHVEAIDKGSCVHILFRDIYKINSTLYSNFT